MRSYKVKSNIRMNKVDYGPGSTIQLTEEEAAKMPWAVELPEEEKAEEPLKVTLEPGRTREEPVNYVDITVLPPLVNPVIEGGFVIRDQPEKPAEKASEDQGTEEDVTQAQEEKQQNTAATVKTAGKSNDKPKRGFRSGGRRK